MAGMRHVTCLTTRMVRRRPPTLRRVPAMAVADGDSGPACPCEMGMQGPPQPGAPSYARTSASPSELPPCGRTTPGSCHQATSLGRGLPARRRGSGRAPGNASRPAAASPRRRARAHARRRVASRPTRSGGPRRSPGTPARLPAWARATRCPPPGGTVRGPAGATRSRRPVPAGRPQRQQHRLCDELVPSRRRGVAVPLAVPGSREPHPGRCRERRLRRVVAASEGVGQVGRTHAFVHDGGGRPTPHFVGGREGT